MWSLAVRSSVSGSSSATSITCATCSENAVNQSEFTDMPNDIGSLNQEQKYNLLKSHFVPSDMFSFPMEYSAGCNRCFQAKLLKQLDGIFLCILCFICKRLK